MSTGITTHDSALNTSRNVMNDWGTTSCPSLNYHYLDQSEFAGGMDNYQNILIVRQFVGNVDWKVQEIRDSGRLTVTAAEYDNLLNKIDDDDKPNEILVNLFKNFSLD